MKATELMIGDWVGRVFDDKRIDYRQVDWIRTGEIGMRYQKVWAIGCIEPIPLTAKILEKNGFVFREDNDIMCGEYYLHNQSTFAIKMFNGYLVGMCMGEDLEFHYVHELQHALRLCGLNEIADNFKV